MSIVASSLLAASAVGMALAAPVGAELDIISPADPWTPFVTEASQRFGVPTPWIRAILNAESAGDAHALSPKGAAGLMQLMPKTWGELRSRYGLGADPFDPRDNILAGTAYIRELIDRYGAPGFLAAYNAGPTRYDDHLETGRPLPPETRAFVAALLPIVTGDKLASEGVAAVDALAWTRAPLFVERAAGNLAADRVSNGAPTRRALNAPEGGDVSVLEPQSDGLFALRMDRKVRQ